MASKFELSDTTPGAPSGKVNVKWQFDTLGNISAYVDPPSGGGAVSSVFGRTGAVIAVAGDYDAAKVTNAVDTTQTYSNPAWLTSLAWSKITGAPATGVSTVFGRSGAVTAQSGDYSASQITNAVDQTATYSNPAWITSLAWGKISGAPTLYTDPLTTKGDLVARGTSTTRLGVGSDGQVLTSDSAQSLGVKWATPASAPVSSVFSRTGAVVAVSGDYTAAMVTNAVDQTATYSNPAWITSLAWSKISGAPSVGSYQTPWLQDVNGNNFNLNNAKGIGIGSGAVVTYAIYAVMNATGNIIAFFQNTNAGGAGGFTVQNDGSHSGNIMCAGSAYPNTAWRNNTIVNAGGTTDNLILATNSVERITITSAGYVGIANTAATLPDSTTNSPRLIVGATTSSSPFSQITACGNVGSSNPLGGFNFANYAISATEKRIAGMNCLVDTTADSGILFFYTFSAGVYGERMRITAGGNVGINCDPSSYRFRVKIATDQHFSLQSGVVVSGAVAVNAMNDAASANVPLEIRASDTVFVNNYLERVRITASGNVGVGTDNPYQTLSVIAPNRSTVATANQFTIGEQSNSPDYRLALGYFNDGPGWKGAIQAIAGAVGTSLLLNPLGGSILMYLGGSLKTLSVDGSGFVKAS